MVGGICRLFQFLHDFFCLDQFNAVGFFIKQLHDEKVIGFIRMVFYLMELLTVIFQSGRILAEGFQLIHGLADDGGSLLYEDSQLFSAV